jgi:tRNA/rRNA methyltransferase
VQFPWKVLNGKAQMNIHFILVEPARPANVGACARALKTMGFRSLRLVNPSESVGTEARRLAYGAQDVLEQAGWYSDLESAVADIDFLIGTTAERRTVKHDYYRCEQVPDLIAAKAKAVTNVGLLFGREARGLTNAELARCDILTGIPMATDYPSLNLAQAVMVYAYLLSGLVIPAPEEESAPPDPGAYTALKRRIEKLLVSVGFDPESSLYHRILERVSILKTEDVHLLHSICQRLESRVDTGGAADRKS